MYIVSSWNTFVNTAGHQNKNQTAKTERQDGAALKLRRPFIDSLSVIPAVGR